MFPVPRRKVSLDGGPASSRSGTPGLNPSFVACELSHVPLLPAQAQDRRLRDRETRGGEGPGRAVTPDTVASLVPLQGNRMR